MELKELSEKTLALFGVESCENLGGALLKCVMSCDEPLYRSFEDMVKDLSVDWLQKIYQYYMADRKNRGQDFTPASLARLAAELVGGANVIVDLCAGSGALTIQASHKNLKAKYELHEIDDNVIPYLLFNMAIRNINCTVYHTDILQSDVFRVYVITPGTKYGICKEFTYDQFINI